MHLLSLVCTCNTVFATCVSDSANLSFWSDNMGYMYSVASNLSLVFSPYPFFGMEWNGVLYPFTMSKILWSCVIFIPAPTKCLILSANKTSGILIDKKNHFINGWNFLDSSWIGFSGFKSMLKKVCCGAVIPAIFLLLTPCLSVVNMTLLVLLLVTIMGSFRSGICKKTFVPHIFSVPVMG